jgi:hypothetical protein
MRFAAMRRSGGFIWGKVRGRSHELHAFDYQDRVVIVHQKEDKGAQECLTPLTKKLPNLSLFDASMLMGSTRDRACLLVISPGYTAAAFMTSITVSP